VIGVIIACAAWPILTRVWCAPRSLFLRLAVLVTRAADGWNLQQRPEETRWSSR